MNADPRSVATLSNRGRGANAKLHATVEVARRAAKA